MSQYVNFFIKVRNDFIPVGSYSRNSDIYQMFRDWAPYEKITSLNQSAIESFLAENEREIIKWRNMFESNQRLEKEINSWNNSIEEKFDAIENLRETNSQIEETLEEKIRTKSFLHILSSMIEEIRWTNSFEAEPENYIYVGIEIGYPTFEDIV